jgi:hypothetical protein
MEAPAELQAALVDITEAVVVLFTVPEAAPIPAEARTFLVAAEATREADTTKSTSSAPNNNAACLSGVFLVLIRRAKRP